MNRIHRRTAAKRRRAGGNGVPGGTGSAGDLLTVALRHHRAGQAGDAERYYCRALEIDPHRLDVLGHFGKLQMETGNLEGALAIFTRALSIGETEQTKAMFVGCLQRVRYVPEVAGLRSLVVRAMSEPWARPADVAYAAVRLIKSGTVLNECIQRAGTAWPQRLSESQLFGAAGAAALAGDELLRTALECAPVCDVDLEYGHVSVLGSEEHPR